MTQLLPEEFTTRLFNALQRADIKTREDLNDLDLRDFYDYRGVGQTMLHEFIAYCRMNNIKVRNKSVHKKCFQCGDW